MVRKYAVGRTGSPRAAIKRRFAERIRMSIARRMPAPAVAMRARSPRPMSFRSEWPGATSDTFSACAPHEVFIVIAIRLDRRNAIPVEEFSGGKDVLRHKLDAGTIRGARRVGVFRGVVGLGELDELEAVRAHRILPRSQIDVRRINAGMPIEPSVAAAVALFGAGSSRSGLHFRPCNWCSPRGAAARRRPT